MAPHGIPGWMRLRTNLVCGFLWLDEVALEEGVVGVLEDMLEKNGGGAIIHISTISVLTESMRTPPYGAIKAAVNHYTVTQAKSLAPKGIALPDGVPLKYTIEITEVLPGYF